MLAPPTGKAGSAPLGPNIIPLGRRPSMAGHGVVMSIGTRREARERAMSLLYEAECKDETSANVLHALPLEPDPFVVDLVQAVEKHRERIDELIGEFTIDWTLERMPVIDRTLL